MTILVLDDEVQEDYRYLGPEIHRIAEESDYHVYAEKPEAFDLERYEGVIISGSTASVYEEEHEFIEPQRTLIRKCIERDVPLLGICFGHQLVNDALGGVVKEDRRRSTFVEMTVTESDDPILQGVEPVVPVLHADLVVKLGQGMKRTSTTDYNEYFCTRHKSAPVWTVQYHPEYTERVDDYPSDWSHGDRDFGECNATRTIDNFVTFCERR